VRRAGLEIEELPKIDVVLISHNHYDHLDLESLKRIDRKFHPIFLVPLGDDKLLTQNGIQNVWPMDWWEDFKVKDTSITFAPTQHWSARGLFDKCESLWGSFFIKSPDLSIYFAGDTGLASHFKQIRERLGRPDLALLPIGAYEPRYFMKVNHMNPEEAVLAHLDLSRPVSIGMHFGTFPLADEAYDEPPQRLKEALIKAQIPGEEFSLLDHGQSKIIPRLTR
jgi:L-ascorbate metabolism protein UlaG (beta-lactamase superfamily)